ncbi:hypothetical protein [Enterococcus sp. DIV0174]|uniref:hypothetical protein n=1 Tax=Enterococcus sp. DIV0174 TaxID=2774785 RepID=UPI00206A0E25|nr:MAG TPA: Minor structural protein [Caudoviricetes sp.]
MGLLKLVKNRISSEWKEIFNQNVDYLNGLETKVDSQNEATNSRIDNLVLNAGGDSPNEVVDARVNSRGEKFATLQGRLTYHEDLADQKIADTEKELESQKEQIGQLNEVIAGLYAGSGSNVDIYVSTKNGNDKTGDGTEQKPFKTIQIAINQIPLINTSTSTIWIDDGVYLEDVFVRGISAGKIIIRTIQSPSTLDVTKSDMPVKVRSVSFFYCSGYFQAQGLELVDQANAPIYEGRKYSFCCEQGGYLALYKVRVAENTKSMSDHTASYVGGMSKMHIYDSYFANQNQINVSRLFGETRASSTVTGASNNIAFEADNGTVRDGTTSTLSATTKHKASAQGLIIAKGTVLS